MSSAATVLDLGVTPDRLAGDTRYGTSVAIAAESYPGWAGVEHVVVAEGEAGIVDALSAASLCWVFDAPLLLTPGTYVAAPTARALRDIASANPTVTVHVVGGPARIRDRVPEFFETIVGEGNVERIWGEDRFATAREVAVKVDTEAASAGKTTPGVALLSNTAEELRFPDALALSALSARTGAPLLGLYEDEVPAATSRALADLGIAETYIAGGPVAVSEPVVASLAATRLAGPDRYATASAVAREGVDRGWIGTSVVGLAASVPDALSGSVLLGLEGGSLLLTGPRNLPRATWRHLTDGPAPDRVVLFGGEAALGASIEDQLNGAPAIPVLGSQPTASGKAGPKVPVRVTMGVNTEHVSVYRNGTLLASEDVTPYSWIDLGDLPTVLGMNEFRVVAESADGQTARTSVRLTHLGYTWDTYIVVDKSDYRLYFVRGGVLTRVYPVAHGRDGRTPVATWRIDAKYHSDPAGVYGPRKMRLFRKSGSGYSFSPYLIHGTNQPWVIGTQASAGCIRMYSEDVLELYPRVPLKTMAVTRE